MVESKVILNRKDYVKICELLEDTNSDLNMYETEYNKDLIGTTRRKIFLIQNLLKEDC